MAMGDLHKAEVACAYCGSIVGLGNTRLQEACLSSMFPDSNTRVKMREILHDVLRRPLEAAPGALDELLAPTKLIIPS